MCNLSHFKSDLDEFGSIALKLGTNTEIKNSQSCSLILLTQGHRQNSKTLGQPKQGLRQD